MIRLKTTKERIALRQKPKKHKRTVERNGVAFEILILLMLMRVASRMEVACLEDLISTPVVLWGRGS